MANENILDDSYSKIIFFTEMGISIVTLILCVPIKDLFPCCQSNKKYQRDGTIINLLENS